MNLREPASFSQLHGIVELLVGFARESADNVGGKREHGHSGIQLFDKLFEVLGAVRTMHFSQHLRVARLQRQVQMTANTPFRPGHQSNQPIRDIAGLDTGDTEAARGLADLMNVGGFGKQALKQHIKAIPAVFALLAPRA